MKHLTRLLVDLAALSALVAGGGAFFYRQIVMSHYSRDFHRAEIGLTEMQAINLIGRPAHREERGILYARYGQASCVGSCSFRLWWQAPFMSQHEAWSIDFDSNGRAIQKKHWTFK